LKAPQYFGYIIIGYIIKPLIMCLALNPTALLFALLYNYRVG
jgi:hypothetical protein